MNTGVHFQSFPASHNAGHPGPAFEHSWTEVAVERQVNRYDDLRDWVQPFPEPGQEDNDRIPRQVFGKPCCALAP